jgi:hypothetical protein
VLRQREEEDADHAPYCTPSPMPAACSPRGPSKSLTRRRTGRKMGTDTFFKH